MNESFDLTKEETVYSQHVTRVIVVKQLYVSRHFHKLLLL